MRQGGYISLRVARKQRKEEAVEGEGEEERKRNRRVDKEGGCERGVEIEVGWKEGVRRRGQSG